MNSIKVSIVVPIYNVSKYLDKCLSSICNQSYTNLEIILVDDGSTDNSSQICDKYASRDKRIKVIHKCNGGLVSARKAGVNAASGEYTLFVDGDDWIEPDHVGRMIRSLHGEFPDIGTALSLKREYSDGSIAVISPLSDCTLQDRIYYRDEFDELIWPEFICDNDIETFNIPINAWIKLYRTDFIRKCIKQVNDEVTMIEDGLINFICLMNARSMGITHESGYHYMIHDNSMVHSDSTKNVDAIRVAWISAIEYIDKTSIESERKRYYENKWMRLIYYALMVSASEYFSNLSRTFLFPYQSIKNGSRVLVYGLGGYGKGLVRYILSNNRFILSGVSDRQIKVSGKKLISGYMINEYIPEELVKKEFDYIVVTTSRRNITDSIEEYLISSGIDRDKIVHMDQNLFNKEPFSSNRGV